MSGSTKDELIEEEEDCKPLPANIDPKLVKYFVWLQFVANLLINVDMGILPSGSLKIKEELELDNVRFGALGSYVYLGQTIGSALATGVLQSCNPKLVLAICLTLNVLTLLIFT